jgi:hypothetical protein
MTTRQQYVLDIAEKAFRDRERVCEHGKLPACYSCQAYRARILAEEHLPAMIALVYELADKVPVLD